MPPASFAKGHAQIAPITQLADAKAALAAARGLLVDLDGTLIRTDEVVVGARQFLQRNHDRLIILSNNSTDTETGLSLRLERLALPVAPSRIVLAGVEMVRAAARRWPGARTMMIASPALVELADAQGLSITDVKPELVLLGLCDGFSYRDLARAANAIRAGARFVIANPDLTHPGPEGAVVPETGSLAAAITACSGARPSLVFGKPEPDLFVAALDRLGITPETALMIGDNPETDGLGASRLGIASVVLSASLALKDIAPA
jgi:4-nitrophenyl phosphatase